MPVITMNVPCKLQTKAGNDMYGQPKLGTPIPSVCAVLKFVTHSAKTAVKADNSASRGHALELIADIKVLMPKTSTVKVEDFLTVYGVTASVSSVRPMFNVMGKIDHFEVEAVIAK